MNNFTSPNTDMMYHINSVVTKTNIPMLSVTMKNLSEISWKRKTKTFSPHENTWYGSGGGGTIDYYTV